MKAKIGRNVKGIPKVWINKNKIDELDDEYTIKDKEFLNSILLDRKPYFFNYLYNGTKKNKAKIDDKFNSTLCLLDDCNINNLINKDRKELEDVKNIDKYLDKTNLIYSDCVMNNLCRYIEDVKFDINSKLKRKTGFDTFELIFDKSIEKNNNNYQKIRKEIKKFNNKIEKDANSKTLKSQYDVVDSKDVVDEIYIDTEKFIENLFNIVNNEEELVNYIIEIAYKEDVTKAKHLLWGSMAKCVFGRLLKNNGNVISIPKKSKDGDIEYLGAKYKSVEVIINE